MLSARGELTLGVHKIPFLEFSPISAAIDVANSAASVAARLDDMISLNFLLNFLRRRALTRLILLPPGVVP